MPGPALLVGGDRTSRRVLAAMLNDLEYPLICEAESASGVSAICEQRFDLAIVDLRFATGESADIVAALRMQSSPPGKIIAIVGNADHGLEQRILQNGADVVFARPLDWDGLLAVCLINPRSRPHKGGSAKQAIVELD